MRGVPAYHDQHQLARFDNVFKQMNPKQILWVFRRAAEWSIPTRSVSEGQFRGSLTYVSGYDW